jgi:hypothetical protein
MERSAPSPLGLLLVVVLLVSAAGAGAASQPVSVLEGTPRVLPVGPSPESGFDSPTIEVGSALAADTDAIGSRLASLTTAERLATADTEAERRTVLKEELDGVERRLDRLLAAQRRAYRGYANGTVDESELLGELAEVQAAAGPLNDSLSAIASGTGDDAHALRERRATLAAERSALLGPVRVRVLSMLRGTRPAERVAVEGSESGVVLGAIDGEQYVREAFRSDKYDRANASSSFEGTLSVINAARQRYPWVAGGNNPGVTIPPEFADGGVRVATLTHTQGQLTVYFDANTQSVFREIHRLRIADMPTREPVNATNASTTLSVAPTYPGGPMLIGVSGTEEPVSASVYVDGTRVGTAGDDTPLRTLTPHGDTTVTATTAAGNVTVTVPVDRPQR